jgi:hypothetical protein
LQGYIKEGLVQITFRNDDEKLMLDSFIEKFGLEKPIQAFDLIVLFRAYENALDQRRAMEERLAKAITYTSVALSTLEGK